MKKVQKTHNCFFQSDLRVLHLSTRRTDTKRSLFLSVYIDVIFHKRELKNFERKDAKKQPKSGLLRLKVT